jgi:hypothetical protein
MGMNTNEPDMQPFEALVGTWATESTHPELDGVAPGTASFEWLEGHRFLVQRTHFDHALIPDSISVLGPPEDGDGLVMEYFDSRGVRRTYRTSLEDGVWRWWRDVPDFAQRFTAVLAPDAFQGHGELARTPGEWGDDLDVSYRRTEAATASSTEGRRA